MAGPVIANPKVYEIRGDFFARFQLTAKKVIDQGMCGDIVLAVPWQKPDVQLVVKRFSLLDDDHKARSMTAFHAEVRLMQSFDHPHITKCIVAGQCPDYLALCMSYYPRGTLDSYVGSLSVQTSEVCIGQVACALQYLHLHNVAHLDVKLDNIFLDADFSAILGDFGLAIELQPQQTTVQASVCGGTPGYYAPERLGAADDKQLDPYKMDAYSLGVVLWALLMETDPDTGIDYHHTATRDRHLPTHLRELLLKLLNNSPDRRLSVAGFLNRLNQSMSDRSG